MARKVFISFLGFTNYWECVYTKDDFTSKKVRYIQEATLDYLNNKNPWLSNDVALFLLTPGAESANWNDDGQKDKEGNPIVQTGLRTQIERMNLPLQIQTITGLPNGNTEEEIFEIFTRVFDFIQPCDELYFDVTHGFRPLPMLTLVLCNYAKFLKAITVKSITYGQSDSETKKGLIVDLLPLSNIQDWTFAAADYLENGNADSIAKLSEQECRSVLKQTQGKDEGAKKLRMLTSFLKATIEDFQTCRGINIIQSTNISKLKETISDLQASFIEPLNPILDKVRASIDQFDSNENVNNGFAAARWCLQNGLYQQAATILQENVVTFFCLRHDIRIDDEDNRELVNKAFAVLFNKIDESKWTVNNECLSKFKEILNDELFADDKLVKGFDNLKDVRNDLNHSGMRSKRTPMPAAKIKANIEKCVTIFEEKLCIKM